MAKKYYPRDTTRSTCLDTGDDLDLNSVQGSTAQWDSGTTTDETTGVLMATFDVDISGETTSGTAYNVSIDIAALNKSEVRVQIFWLNSSCTKVANGTSSGWWTGTGIQTYSPTLSAHADRYHLRIEVWVRRATGEHGNADASLNVNDVDTWVEAPWSDSTPANAERDARLHGEDTANAERDARITGEIAASAEKDARLHGEDTASDEKDARLHGEDTASDEKDARITGEESASAERDARIEGGGIEVSDERDARLHGEDTASDEKDARLHGVDTANAERDARLHGVDTANAERDARIDGVEGATDERDARIHGEIAANAERDARIEGGVNEIGLTVITNGGGDYTSINAMESDQQGDLVARNENLTVDCSGTIADTTFVDFVGWTTDPTHGVKLQALASARHTGVFPTSGNIYRFEISNSRAIRCNFSGGMQDFDIDGLCIKVTGTNNNFCRNIDLSQQTARNIIENCILWHFVGGSPTHINPFCLRFWVGSNSIARNNIMYGASRSGGDGFFSNGGAPQQTLHNNTVYDCETGYDFGGATAGSPELRNNTYQSNGIGGATGYAAGSGSFSWHANTSHNLSDLSSDAPGTDAKDDSDVIYVDAANGDFHLSLYDIEAGGTGVDLSGQFTLDAAGVTRVVPWDRGALEAAGTPAIGERDARIWGEDTATDERDARVQGSLTASDEKDARISGVLGANAERDARIDAFLIAITTVSSNVRLVNRFTDDLDADLLLVRIAQLSASVRIVDRLTVTVATNVHLVLLTPVSTDVRLVNRFTTAVSSGLILKNPYELNPDKDIFTGFDVIGPDSHFQAVNDPPANPDDSEYLELSISDGPDGKIGILETHRLTNVPLSERLGTITGVKIFNRVAKSGSAGSGGQIIYAPALITQKANQWQPDVLLVDLLDPDIFGNTVNKEVLIEQKYTVVDDQAIVKGALGSTEQLPGGGKTTIVYKVMWAPSSPSKYTDGDQYDLVGNTIQWNDTKIPAPVLGSATVQQTAAGANWSLVPHFWVIAAINSWGETVQSNEVTATPVNTDDRIRLDWTKAPNATGYRIYRSQTTGVYTTPALVAEVGDVATYNDDDGNTPGAGTPAGANTCQDEPEQGSTYYADYRHLKANTFFDWDDFGNNINPPEGITPSVLQDTFGVGWPYLTTPVQNDTSVLQDEFGANWDLVPHYYVITAVNENGETLQSNEKTATPVNTDDRIQLDWDNVTGATAYRIYRSQTTGDYSSPALVAVVALSGYTDANGSTPGAGTPAVSNTAIRPQYYVLTSTNSGTGEETGPSHEVKISPVNADDRIQLDWTDGAGADGYKVFRSLVSGSYGNALRATLGAVTTYTDDGSATGAGSPNNDMNARIEIVGSVFTPDASTYRQRHFTAWVQLLRFQDTEPILSGWPNTVYAVQLDADVKLIHRTTLDADTLLVRLAQVSTNTHLVLLTQVSTDVKLVHRTTVGADVRLVDRFIDTVEASTYLVRVAAVAADVHLVHRTTVASDTRLVDRRTVALNSTVQLVHRTSLQADLYLVRTTSVSSDMRLVVPGSATIGVNRFNREGPGWGF